MKINKIKIAGFKSFANPVEVDILDGITGIVGPNGCGKSNLIESMRWAMGETSAKRLRGDAMDDVIFGGTEIRPPRKYAEVSLYMENPEKLGPPEFKNIPEMIVSRRIDRGDGSKYKVNGNTVRAKDVQVLYKDAGMGAGSSALVSQGMVAAIINAKPVGRRNLLEEAAGVAGLSSRKHEAELRLRGTEENLEKAEVTERGLNDQVSSLRRQARAAKRRREIDGMIRSAEAMMFLVRRNEIEEKMEKSSAAQNENEKKVEEALVSQLQNEKSLKEMEDDAAPLLEQKIAAETAFAIAKNTADNIKKEILSVKNALSNADKLINRSKSDVQREEEEIELLKEEIALLKDEILGAEDDAEYDVSLTEENTILFEEAKEEFEAASRRASSASDTHSLLVAGKDALIKRIEDIDGRLKSIKARSNNTIERKKEIEIELSKIPPAPEELSDFERQLEDGVKELRSAHEEAVATTAASQEARAQEASLTGMIKALKAELELLEKIPVGDGADADCDADEGYDEALAVALGSAYHAPIGSGDVHWWCNKDLLPPSLLHPSSTQPLISSVKVPEALVKAISAIGVVENVKDGERLSRALEPGQSIVSKMGHLWRWDGYQSSGDNAKAEATRRRRRISEINSSLIELPEKISSLNLDEVSQRLSIAIRNEEKQREIIKSLELKIDEIKKSQEENELKRNKAIGQIAGLAEASKDVESQLEEENKKRLNAQNELNSYTSINASEQALSQAREAQTQASKNFETARMNLDKVKRDAEARVIRVGSIKKQIADIERRLVVHGNNVAELKNRKLEAIEEKASLEKSPLLSADAESDAIADVQEKLEDLLAAQEMTKSLEEKISQSKEQVRLGLENITSLKESRATLIAELKAAQESFVGICKDIEERIKCKPEDLMKISGLADGDDIPDIQTCEARVQRLMRERETLGTVNLLAEQQLEEVEEKAGQATKFRNELREAVKQLRESITKINTECRERILEAFVAIDANFRSLFKRVFDGGEAHLKLSGSDDPLEAGLEIYASPPGKKLQTMSLFSGGEQALMALSLIFAAFLIRPSPVCVLDEVDAPFDDANVDRMCNLVSDLAKDGTRFLMITHHALTMARCDRLYGVTMAERGVSRVMTVDTDEAVQYVQDSGAD